LGTIPTKINTVARQFFYLSGLDVFEENFFYFAAAFDFSEDGVEFETDV